MGKKPKTLIKAEEADVREIFINFVVGTHRLTYLLLGRKKKRVFLQELITNPQSLVIDTTNRIDKLMIVFMTNRGVKEPLLIDDMTAFCQKVADRLKKNLSSEIEQLGLETPTK